jgi:NADP-dependent 3-hydroxy acid dehydrogenase YdfG
MTTVLDRFRLDDKVAIVTGASSGLGVAFAKALAEAGADLVLAARRVERLEATRAIVAQAGRRAIAVAADMTLPENALAVVEAAMKEFGHVDVLVNNAGKGTAVPATRETPEQFREVIDINLNGCLRSCHAARQLDHQHRQRRSARKRRAPAGGIFGEQGRPDRADA